LRFGTKAEVVIVVRSDVFFPAIGHDLEEPGPGAGANLSRNLPEAIEKVEHIVLLDSLGGQAVSARPVANGRAPLPPALMRVDRIAIVFANKNDRQMLEHREVEALGENAFLGGAVAEEADDDGV